MKKYFLITLVLVGWFLIYSNASAVTLTGDVAIYGSENNDQVDFTCDVSTSTQKVYLYNVETGESVSPGFPAGSCYYAGYEMPFRLIGTYECFDDFTRYCFYHYGSFGLGDYSIIEATSTACNSLNYSECKADGSFVDEELWSFVSVFLEIPVSFVTSTLAYVGQAVTGLGPLLYLVVGAPFAFWAIRKAIGLVPKK